MLQECWRGKRRCKRKRDHQERAGLRRGLNKQNTKKTGRINTGKNGRTATVQSRKGLGFYKLGSLPTARGLRPITAVDMHKDAKDVRRRKRSAQSVQNWLQQKKYEELDYMQNAVSRGSADGKRMEDYST